MSETTSPEFTDLDAWLDGAKRTERAVTLYARADLLADIDRLEAKLRQEKAIAINDDAFAGGSAGDELEKQIDALYEQMDASRMEFRVSFLDDEEQAAIRDGVVKDLKDAADAAASKARAYAREQCRRAEINAANDINVLLRNAATAASEAVIEREFSIRVIAAAVVQPKMSVDQVRKMNTVIGDSQVALLLQAFTRATIEAPQVAVPKSSKPSPSHDGLTSS